MIKKPATPRTPPKTGRVFLRDIRRGDTVIATLPCGPKPDQNIQLRLEATEDAHPELAGLVHSEAPREGGYSCKFCKNNGKPMTLTDYPGNEIAMIYAPVFDGTVDVYSMVRAERAEQITYGFNAAHDDTHKQGEIALGAAAFIIPADVREKMQETTGRGPVISIWPWRADQFHPSSDRIHELVKGIAMAVAEVERLQRAAQNAGN